MGLEQDQFKPFGGKVILKDNRVEQCHDRYGNYNVAIQDQFTEPVSLYLGRQIDLATISVDVNVGDYQVTFTSDTLPVVGYRLCMKHETSFTQPEITAVAGTNPYTVTIDSPSDAFFPVGSACYMLNTNLASITGTQANPQIYQVSPRGLTEGLAFDITGLTVHIIDSSAMDDGMFASSTKLINGLVFRGVNGGIKNTANIKRNGDFGDYGFTVDYVDKAPSGKYALRAYLDIRAKYGVVTRIVSAGEDSYSAQILVQDNIVSTGRDIHVLAHGHVVDDF